MEKIHNFFSNGWAVEGSALNAELNLISPSILAGNLSEIEKYLDSKRMRAVAMLAPNVAKSWQLDDANLPTSSVAVLDLSGMLYVWETEWLLDKLCSVEQNPAVCGVVLRIDGPGGHATMVDTVAEKIRTMSKPVATLITGCMCSAHFWIGTSAGRIFAASDICEVGSVGTLYQYMGMRKYFEMNGVDFREIYPESSDLKNAELRTIEETGDESKLKERLTRLHLLFCKDVAKNLGIEYNPKSELFRGKTYFTDDAISLGLINQKGSLEDALMWVLTQAASRQANI